MALSQSNSTWPEKSGPMTETTRTCSHCGRLVWTYFMRNQDRGQWVTGWTHLEEADGSRVVHGPERCRNLLKQDLDVLRGLLALGGLNVWGKSDG